MRLSLLVLPTACCALVGCNALSGVDDLRFREVEGATGSAAGGGPAVASGAGGQAGNGGETASCDGGVPPGTPCADGTIYAGASPLGPAMYTTPCDVGMQWGSSGCTGSRDRIEWGSQGKVSGTADAEDGAANTTALVDEASDPHPAAEACRAFGSEWYLPAIEELKVLYVNQAAIGGFYLAGCGAPDLLSCYWSSTEASSERAWRMDYANGSSHDPVKGERLTVRCVRK